jgi:MtN3 and saliva related transmembrane protein
MSTEILIGFIAGILTTGAYIPQAYKVYKTKQTRDISLIMFLLMTTGIAGWLIYGIMVNALPIILANGISLLLSIYILVVKIRNYFKKPEAAVVE